MKTVIKKILHWDIRLPAAVLVIVRGLYRGGVLVREALDALYAAVVVKPVMQAIVTGGRRLRIERIPYIRGKGQIAIGDDVYISGLLGVSFLHREGVLITEKTEKGESKNKEQRTKNDVPSTGHQIPWLKIGSRSFIGHQCSFALSSHILIGDDCMIGAGTRIQDNDGHPINPAARLRRERVPLTNVRPVIIGNNVWVAPRCTILKGVTIGDDAVVGAESVVTHDVSARTVVAGNPAREIGKTV